MSSGDRKRTQNAVDYGANQSQNVLNNYQAELSPELHYMDTNYQGAVDRNFADYDNIMSQLNSYNPLENLTPITADTVDYSRTPEFQQGMDYYKNFADTGGFSNRDIQDLRARGISPIRSVYANAMNDIDRQRNLSGGYAPNALAVRAKMARELSSGIADQVSNVNAQLAQMVQQGKEFGTTGYGTMSTRDLELATQTALANASAINAANTFNAGLKAQADQANTARLNAMTDLYSATPGLSSTFGNQVLSGLSQYGNLSQQQQNINNARTQGQFANAQVPTGTQAALGNIDTGMDILKKGGEAAGNIAKLF